MNLPVSVTGMLAHGHGNVGYAHYGLDLYPHDANYTVGSIANVVTPKPKKTQNSLLN